MRPLLSFLRARPWLAHLAALAGFLVYAALLWQVTRNQLSVLDEGLYLYKGWLFVSGAYIPFQDNGVWMNQMPLSYWIPGLAQSIFGPGLETGRAFAFVAGLLALIALWRTTWREANPWAAAALVWAAALNPAATRIVGMAASQGLVSLLLAWTMFFSLGASRRPWHLFVGGLLASATVMVRINILPLLPLLALYVFWQHLPPGEFPKKITNSVPSVSPWLTGFYHSIQSITQFFLISRATHVLLVGMLLVFLGVHALYWPNILRLWAKWLPLPFLTEFSPPPNTQTWAPDNPLGFRVASFFLGFRYHFAAMAGMLLTWVLWRPQANAPARKIGVFLSALLLVFVLLHAWAALGNEYCVFCFPTYTAFYSGLGLLLVAISLPQWNLSLSGLRRALGLLLPLALLGGMAYSAEGTLADLLGDGFYKRLLNLPAPGFNGAALWQVLANRFGLEYETLFDWVHAGFPVAASVALGLGIFAAGILFRGRKNSEALGAGVAFFLLMGLVFSPSPLLAGEYQSYDCPVSVLAGYKSAGAQLAQVIPPGAQVYWAGYSPVTLLYLPKIALLPGQLHGTYSFRISEDDAGLLRYGWWNQALAEGWLAQADFVLVEARNLGREDWLNAQLAGYEPILRTAPQSCRADSAMLVFRRK